MTNYTAEFTFVTATGKVDGGHMATVEGRTVSDVLERAANDNTLRLPRTGESVVVTIRPVLVREVQYGQIVRFEPGNSYVVTPHLEGGQVSERLVALVLVKGPSAGMFFRYDRAELNQLVTEGKVVIE